MSAISWPFSPTRPNRIHGSPSSTGSDDGPGVAVAATADEGGALAGVAVVVGALSRGATTGAPVGWGFADWSPLAANSAMTATNMTATSGAATSSTERGTTVSLPGRCAAR